MPATVSDSGTPEVGLKFWQFWRGAVPAVWRCSEEQERQCQLCGATGCEKEARSSGRKQEAVTLATPTPDPIHPPTLPASSIARQPPHTLAMLLLPLLSVMVLSTRTV
jgi:hypothetical protein